MLKHRSNARKILATNYKNQLALFTNNRIETVKIDLFVCPLILPWIKNTLLEIRYATVLNPTVDQISGNDQYIFDQGKQKEAEGVF